MQENICQTCNTCYILALICKGPVLIGGSVSLLKVGYQFHCGILKFEAMIILVKGGRHYG